MKKLFILLIPLLTTYLNSDTLNLMMIIGIEKLDSTDKPNHILFAEAIKNKEEIQSWAILVSNATLTGFIKEYKKQPQNIESQFNFKCEWNIFEIPNNTAELYYLFIKKRDINKFKNTLKIPNKTIEFENIYTLNLGYKPHEEDFNSLIDNLFLKNKENKDTLNIFLTGHGGVKVIDKNSNAAKEYSVLDSSNQRKNQTVIGPLADQISKKINNLDPRSLNGIKSELAKTKTAPEIAKILEKYGINIENKNNVYTNIIKDFIQNIILLKSHTRFESCIACVDIKAFPQFIKFLNKYVNINYLYIASCCVGGINSLLAYSDLEINFSIVHASSYEENICYDKNVASFFLSIFKKLTEGKNLKQEFENMLNTTKRPSQTYIPMIRPKNQTEWFPLFRNVKSAQFNTYNITKTIVDTKYFEQTPFNFTSNDQVFVTTSYINVPVLIKYKCSSSSEPTSKKMFIFRQSRVFFKEIELESPISSADDLESMFNIFFQQDGSDIVTSILIKKVIIKKSGSNEKTELRDFSYKPKGNRAVAPSFARADSNFKTKNTIIDVPSERIKQRSLAKTCKTLKADRNKLRLIALHESRKQRTLRRKITTPLNDLNPSSKVLRAADSVNSMQKY